MALSRIQRGMIDTRAVIVPNNLDAGGTASANTFLTGSATWTNTLSTITISDMATIRGISITTSTGGRGIGMNNTNIEGVNALYFADSGPDEGVNWFGGNWWRIYDSPDDLVTNTTGNLQFVSSGTRVLTLGTDGRVEIPGNLTVSGTTTATNFQATNFTATNLTTVGTVKLTGLATGTSTYILYYNDSTGQVTYSAGGGGAANPFDQSLNTTDSPRFVGLTATGVVTIASTVTVSAGLGLRVSGLRASANSQQIVFNTATGELTYVQGPGQSLFTTSSVTFAALTATTRVDSGTIVASTRLTSNADFDTPRALVTRLEVGCINVSSTYTDGDFPVLMGTINNVLFPNRAAGSAATAGKVLRNTGVYAIGSGYTVTGSEWGDAISTSTSTFTELSSIQGSVHFPESPSQRRTVIRGSLYPETTATFDIGSKGKEWRSIGAQTGYFDNITVTGVFTYTGIGLTTASISGLSTVGWSNNYNDLTNRFLISTVTNQSLFTTSTVVFQALTVTTGTRVTQSLAVGGFPLGGTGTAQIAFSNTQSVAMVVSNDTAGLRSQVNIRGYGQNSPNGTSATAGNGILVLEGSRGTNTVPTATGANDTIGAIHFSGYDGSSWLSSQATNVPGGVANLPPASIIGLATEAFSTSSSVTSNAGTSILMRIQPQGALLNSTSRRTFFGQTWTAGTTATGSVIGSPPILNLGIGQASGDTSIVTITPSNSIGVYGTGSGRTNMAWNGVQHLVYGVPAQDTAGCDNATLTATNVFAFVTGRRNSFAGRRDALIAGDTVFSIVGNAQTSTNSTGNGQFIGNMGISMLENAGNTARGGQFFFQTVNTGTTTVGTRLVLQDRASQYYSDTHSFREKNGTFTALSLTTSSAAFGSGVVISGYKKCFGDFLNTGTITFTANTGTAIALVNDTVSNCTVQSGSQILISQAGDYNLQFSAQIENGNNSEHDAWFWIRKNGVDVAQSATKYTVIKSGANVAALTFNISSNGTDYYEIVCAVNSTNLTLPSYAANSQGFPGPAIPAVIVNLIPIGA